MHTLQVQSDTAVQPASPSEREALIADFLRQRVPERVDRRGPGFFNIDDVVAEEIVQSGCQA